MKRIFVFFFLTAAFSSCAMHTHTAEKQELPLIDAFGEVSILDISIVESELVQEFIAQEKLSEEPVENFTVSPPVLFDLMDVAREKFGKILDNPDEYEVQILLTQITRNNSGRPLFTSVDYELDTTKYFYPASTVKMAIAALTLQKINTIAGADRSCVLNVAGSKNGIVGRSGFTIEKYIYRMMVYSDNTAYNRLYDFLGQEYINETLHVMGYQDCQIVRRFSMPTSAAADRVNYPWELRDEDGLLIYSQIALSNDNIYSLRERYDMTGLLRGRARIASDVKISTPKEFYDYNYMSIEVMQNILKALIFPLEVEESARFILSEDDREYLLSCMQGEDTQRKYFIYGGKDQAKPHIEIYNKTGTSYGNIIDNAYILDTVHHIEFMLTAVIYVNPNGVIGDGVYDYEKTGMPFLQELSLAVYDYYLDRYLDDELR